jgi:hypothetical protein
MTQQGRQANSERETKRASARAESRAAESRGTQDEQAQRLQRVQQGVGSEADVVQLQRSLGNHTVSRLLIQRKPADIDGTFTLNYDNTGKLLNAGAVRATTGRRTAIINAQLTKGWVTPNNLQLKGGHLFKREFGGVDDDTNVVPWLESNEAAFGVVEDEYKAAADKDAATAAKSNQAFTATVKTNATFFDRPDLQVSDDDLDKAGWTSTDPDRAKRKNQYDDVADKFSGIPTTVTVKATGLSVGDKTFTRSADQVAPAFTRNPEGIKPTYGIPNRFKRHATETRKLSTILDWNKYKGKKKDPDDVYRGKKLMHVIDNHGVDWGVTKNSVPDLERLQGILETFILNTSNEQIEGVYLLGKIEALFYVNDTSKLFVGVDTAGKLISGWKLSDDQYTKLTTKGVLP